MFIKYVVFVLISINLSLSEDDKKWKWSDNNRQDTDGRKSRYQVFEDEEPLGSYQNYQQYQRPNNAGFIPQERPGGVYNNFDRPNGGNYGQGQGGYYPDREQDVLTGPIPSWVQDGPFKNYDRCRCTEKFNCRSPGISYGHCDVGKQYCCYTTNRRNELGGPNPSRPIHSIDNGVLVGPDGPYDLPNGGRRPGGVGGGYRPRPIGNYPGGRPVLAGPGGPFDRPNIGGGGSGGYGGYYGRSNQS